MSANEQIAKLEELLARIHSRAAAPRAAASRGVPMQAAPPPMAAAAEPDPDLDDVDVEVSTETVEVDIDVDEPTAMESGAQPVMHPTAPPDELEEVTEDGPLPTQPTPNLRAGMANEIDEPEPASSPRPIDAPYEEESAPRHTPPPESGKQVASSPSAHPPKQQPQPSAVPSEAPPSLEGHTLIGGWREPGLGPDGKVLGPQIGVRAPAAPPPSSPALPPQASSGTRLTPDVTRPNLPATAKVATFEGAAPVARPATFGELLDLTLGTD